MSNKFRGRAISLDRSTLGDDAIGAHLNAASEQVKKDNKTEEILHKTMLKNQKLAQEAAVEFGHPNIDFSLAVKAALDNITAFELVGCQPMECPRSLLYQLKFVSEDEDKLMRLEVVSTPIDASTKKLSANWDIEAKQDLKIFHGLDVEMEILRALGKEIAMEYNQEIITDLGHLATKMAAVIHDDKELLVHIQRAANAITSKTRRGVGNWIVVSKNVTKRLKPNIAPTDGKFVDLDDDEALAKLPDLFKYGILNGSQYVYVNKWHMDEHTEGKSSILVGYKGAATEVDTGYIMAPFQLILSSGVGVDPNTFSPILSLMTRYAKYFDAENGKDYYVNIDLTFED